MILPNALKRSRDEYFPGRTQDVVFPAGEEEVAGHLPVSGSLQIQFPSARIIPDLFSTVCPRSSDSFYI